MLQTNNRKTPASKPIQKSSSTTSKNLTVPKPFHSFITPSAKKVSVNKPRYTDLRDITDSSHVEHLRGAKESIDNHTFNIMNISSSTEVDGPAMSHLSEHPNLTTSQNTFAIPSFSPLLRRIEQTIDEKLATFMNSFRNQTLDVETTVVRQSMKLAVQEGIQEVRRSLNIEDTVTVSL